MLIAVDFFSELHLFSQNPLTLLLHYDMESVNRQPEQNSNSTHLALIQNKLLLKLKQMGITSQIRSHISAQQYIVKGKLIKS